MKVYITINLTDFQVRACITQKQVAEEVNCHRDTISRLFRSEEWGRYKRSTINDVLIIEADIDQIRRPGAGKRENLNIN